MNTKLTLTIDDSLIVRAKALAQEQGRSLSDMVESYFKLVTSRDYPVPGKIPDEIMDLKGSFNAPDDFDYKKILLEEITKKHL
jgi:hypothetical protein